MHLLADIKSIYQDKQESKTGFALSCGNEDTPPLYFIIVGNT